MRFISIRKIIGIEVWIYFHVNPMM